MELEKQFFSTFGIEPEIFTGCKLEKNNWKEDTCPFEKDGIMELCHKVCKYAFTEREIYPTITDRILLELICIYNVFVRMDFYSSYVKDLKIEVLETLIKEYKNRKQTGAFDENLKEKVQALFKEER